MVNARNNFPSQSDLRGEMVTEKPSEIRKVAFLGNYLPRKCGIATFTADLRCVLETERQTTDTAGDATAERSACGMLLLAESNYEVRYMGCDAKREGSKSGTNPNGAAFKEPSDKRPSRICRHEKPC